MDWQRVEGSDSSNASVTLITPGANQIIKILQVKLNCQNADTILFLSNSTEIDKNYLGVTSGFIYNFGNYPLYTLAPGDPLVLTKTAANPVSWNIWYVLI